MQTNSLKRCKCSCGKVIGGVKSVALIERSGLGSFDLDPADNSYSGVSINARGGFTLLRFAEGAARYDEVCRRENGTVAVTHSIEFVMDKMDRESYGLLREIASASLCGLVAVITTAGGSSFVVGYSEELLDERPLRLYEAESSSGEKYTDNSGVTIRLRSKDISKARTFTGTL